MNSKNIIITVIVACIVVLFFIIINIDPKTEVEIEHFEKIFGKTRTQKNVIPDQINIIIDRSASIQGFVFTPNNEFIRTIQDFIQNVPKTIPIKTFALDANISLIDSGLLAALNLIGNIKFYNGSQTNISAILSLPEVQNKNNLTLIFSDWIHSLKNDLIANQMIIFSRELKDFINTDGLFAMFGKKAPFYGIYYVECKPPLSLKFNNLTRPYFCIVLGNNNHSHFLKKYIEPFYDEEMVVGTRENTFTDFNSLSDFEDWTDPLDSSNIVKIKLLDPDSISFSLSTKENLKFNQKLYPFIEVCRVTFEDDSIIDPKMIKNSSIRLDSIKDLKVGQEYFLTVFFPPQEEQQLLAKISFYQEMPDWIASWSTDCDNNLMEAQKVYQLNRWINDYIYNDLDIKYKTSFTKYLYIWR